MNTTSNAAEKPSADELLKLLAEFLWQNDDCDYDHNGRCQAHSLDDFPCPHQRAKAILKANGVPYDE